MSTLERENIPKSSEDDINPFWLPNDIIRHIMESYLSKSYLSRSPEDIKSCTLVCRSWKYIAQPILFDLATVDITKKLPVTKILPGPWPSVALFISADPGCGTLIRHLKLAVPNEYAVAALPYCTQIRSLTLSDGFLTSSFLQQMPWQTFPLLRKLRLTVVNLEQLVQCLQLIYGELELEDLSLSLDFFFKRSLYIPDAPPPSFSTIRSFGLYDTNGPGAGFTPLLDYLRPILLKLHRLVTRKAVPGIFQLVDANEATLKTLDIFEIFDISHGRIPRLLQNGILRDILFKLPVEIDQLADYLSALRTMFLDIDWNRSSVRFISFDISWPYRLVDMELHCDLWARLVEALCRHPGLEMMTLILEDGGELEHGDADYGDGYYEHCITHYDVQDEPAFEPLLANGRFDVVYRPEACYHRTF